MKKINNPNSSAISKFTLPWDSYEDNLNIRSLEYTKVRSINKYYNTVEMDLTIKFINESTDIDTMSIEYDYLNFDKYNYDPIRFCIIEFSHFIIFVKEFNAYYKAEYSASYDGGLKDREVNEDYLEFYLLPVGEFTLEKNDFRKLATKKLQEWINNY